MMGINPFIKPAAITISAIIKTTFFSSSMLLQKQTPTTTATTVARIMETVPICLMANGVLVSNIYFVITSAP